MNTTTHHKGLDYWRQQLAEQHMPVLAQTANTIVKRVSDEDSSAMGLARLILKDVSMTTRVLRMANSSQFNPGTGRITTVSRAVVLLGFDTVRNICLSISLIDSFLSGPHRNMVIAEMAHCFHAAQQAKSLAELSHQKEAEEVFIAALLYRLGTLAFWCFVDSIDDGLAARMKAAVGNGMDQETQEQALIGFRLDELTASLNQHWGLSSLLGSALDSRSPATPRTKTIRWGHEIAKALAAEPGARPLDLVLAEIEHDLKIAPADATAWVQSNAKDAAEAMALLGAPDAARLIAQIALIEVNPDDVPSGREAQAIELPAPAAAVPAAELASLTLQLEILGELATLLDEPRPNVNLMLEMVLEGLYRGVGMDRAIFALLSADRQHLRAKFVLAPDREQLKESFVFPVARPQANALAFALSSGRTLWFGNPEGDPQEVSVDANLQRLSGGAFFVMPLIVAGKAIGVIYADRGSSGRVLDAGLFGQFKLFGQQARLGLSYLKGGS